MPYYVVLITYIVLGHTKFNVVRLVLADQGDTCYNRVRSSAISTVCYDCGLSTRLCRNYLLYVFLW